MATTIKAIPDECNRVDFSRIEIRNQKSEEAHEKLCN